MTDLLSPADTPTVKIVAVPTRPTPVVRADLKRHGPQHRRVPTSVRARRGGRRGRWAAVIVLAVMDITVAGFLLLTVLFPLSPVPDGAPPVSSVPSPVVVPSTTGGGVPVAAHASPRVRPPGGPDGGTSPGATTSTTASSPVVHDAASARGQTPGRGPAGGPASTTTAVPSTAPPTPSSSVPDPSTTTSTSTTTTTSTVPDTTPTPPSTELLP